MNNNKIVHRDLKTNNILITFENDYFQTFPKFKISDYGVSKLGKLNSLTTLTIGTHFYFAPEILEFDEEKKEKKKYDYKCDLWSLGIIIYELCFQVKPYEGSTQNELLSNIRNKGKKDFKKTGVEQLDNLINDLLEVDPKIRLSWDEYFNHPFFIDYNCITIKYENSFGYTKIFNKKFVENNKKNCRIKYKYDFYELKTYFDSLEDILEIKLIGYINDMSYMFKDCASLISTDLPKSHHTIDMSYMFYGCESLKSLPDISLWDTSKVISMSNMFNGCESLESLPDLSLWNTHNITDMSYMFYGCTSLESLPDLSLWKTNNIINISYMFYGCYSLLSLPDLSLWNTEKMTNMNCIFNFCCSLESLPDLSKWNNINYDITSIRKCMKIIIKYNSYSFNLEVAPSYTIELVKLKIKVLSDILYDFCLMYKGKILENERLLESYNITDGDSISCIIKTRDHSYIPIKIRYKDQTTEISVCLCYKIDYLKEVISRKLFLKPEYQKISFNGKFLDEETIDLGSLGIKKDSILDLKLKNCLYDYDDIFDYKKKYEKQIFKLIDMGFKESEINIDLLKKCLGNIQYYFLNKD